MNIKTIKTSFLIAVLSAFLAACSSTPTEEDTDGTGETGETAEADASRDGVTTGTADRAGAYGEDEELGAGGVATVFYFDFDKATLPSEARSALDKHARRLKNHPVEVRLEGHADERGTREYNMALGERRAESVKEYLVLQGVDPDILEVISYGEERPAALGSDESSYALNRRVEMTRQ